MNKAERGGGSQRTESELREACAKPIPQSSRASRVLVSVSAPGPETDGKEYATNFGPFVFS